MASLLASSSFCALRVEGEELKLQPISPEAAQMDAPPPPPQSAASPSNPFGSSIQGQPLSKGAKSSFAPAEPALDEPREAATPQDEFRLTALEQKAFGTTYSEHEAVDRLDHLEKEVFGSVKQGALGERIARLETKLLGGSAFGAGSGSTFSSTFGGAFGSAGGGSRPVASLPSGSVPNMAPAQSGWQNPQSMPPQNSAPAQSGWQIPQNITPQNTAPAQSGWQSPQNMALQNTAPSQSGWQSPQNMAPQNTAPSQSGWQSPQNMTPQNIVPAQSGWQVPAGGGANAPLGTRPSPQYPMQGQPLNYAGRPPAPLSQYGKPMSATNPQSALPSSSSSSAAAASAAPGGLSLDASMVASSLPFDGNAGDYLSAVTAFPGATGSGTTYARWTTFPVRVKVPAGTPDSWTRSVEAVIARWGQYLPVKLALPKEEVNAEIIWVNTLPKGVLGVTRLAVKDGRMRTWIYLLRPSFYPPEIPERALSPVFMRELGHVMGLYCKSDRAEDLMYQPPAGTAPAKVFARTIGLSARDINTLRRLYQSPPLPANLTLNQPMEWATGY